jgi:hypothetical protein
LAIAALLAAAAGAQAARPADSRPVAFTNARLHTFEGDAIASGTLVVRDGRIHALGADVAVPAGAVVVDCKGGSIMPGLVSAFSRAGLEDRAEPREEPRDGRRRRGGPPVDMAPQRSGGGAQNQAATKVVERVYARQRVFGELLREGVTSLALTPRGNGFPGLGAVLRPDGRTLEQLILDDDAFVFVGMARDSQAKKILKEGFEKAKKVVEERKKPKEEAKPAEAKPAEKPAEPPKGNEPPKPPEPKPEPKPDPKPEPKPEDEKEGSQPPQGQPTAQKPPTPPKDPNIEVLADLLEGKRRAILQIDSAADLLHWYHACGEDLTFPRAIAVPRHDTSSGTFDMVVEQAKKLGAAMLLPIELATKPRSRYLIHPARILHDAGIEIGFVVGESRPAVRSSFFQLMELVRTGLPADVALKGVTLVPARALGIDSQVGSLKVGKKANLLVFRGDPLDPTSELSSVWLEGRQVPKDPKD